jgi:hypothetical protein
MTQGQSDDEFHGQSQVLLLRFPAQKFFPGNNFGLTVNIFGQ